MLHYTVVIHPKTCSFRSIRMNSALLGQAWLCSSAQLR
jgi:hypothetical protein